MSKSSSPWTQDRLLAYLQDKTELNNDQFFRVSKDRLIKKVKKKGCTQQYGALTLAFYLGKVYVTDIDFKSMEELL